MSKEASGRHSGKDGGTHVTAKLPCTLGKRERGLAVREDSQRGD